MLLRQLGSVADRHVRRGVLGGSNAPPPPNYFVVVVASLLVREVGHVREYPYPMSGKLTQLFFEEETKSFRCKTLPMRKPCVRHWLQIRSKIPFRDYGSVSSGLFRFFIIQFYKKLETVTANFPFGYVTGLR